ncbi:hypothetical protein C900_01715 [Fulvivirga imtechensis AK7]|uniref:CBU-0592-like domain-containing protein n=1 Tax=Fulvivirga imtechensis AK7 TaxID=1237149 RepID=L8JU53_9BACT|nr:hypothetical protein [Fulvivirga imtechensis]ELR72300.1 hypothetical protein C900_01715 [Fulvivirga imtechensis AK7]
MQLLIIEIIGWVAMVLVLSAFYLNTKNIVSSNSSIFLTMNILAGLFMAINSGYHHAYPSMFANIAWLFIAVIGMVSGKAKNKGV